MRENLRVLQACPATMVPETTQQDARGGKQLIILPSGDTHLAQQWPAREDIHKVTK